MLLPYVIWGFSCFEKKILSCWISNKPYNTKQWNSSTHTTSKKGTDGAKISHNVIFHFIFSLSFPYPLFCGQKWFLVLIQSSALFLFLNSAANPVLTIFRIRELKKSVKISLHLRQEGNERSLYFE